MLEYFDGESLRNALVAFGVLVAVVSVHTARSIARRKQTADLLFASRGDSGLQEGYELISEYNAAPTKNIRSLGSDLAASEEAKKVRYVLNHFESVSVGIQAGIYDEDMLKKCWFTIVIRTYDQAHPMVIAMREKNKPTILQEFEWLAARWKAKPLKSR